MTQPNLPPATTEQRPERAPSRNGSNLSERVRSLRLSDNTQSAGQRGSLLPWILCGLLVVVCAAFGYRAYRVTPVADTATNDTDDSKAQAAALSGATAASSGEVQLEAKGYVTPIHQIQLSPQVGGEIVELDPRFEEGAVYQQGAILAKIDPVIYQAQVKNAQAALSVAQTNLQQVEKGSTVADLEVAKAQLKNMEAKLELSQIDERYNQAARSVVAAQDTEKSTAQVKVDRTAYQVQKRTVDKLTLALDEQRAVATAQVESAKANLDQANKQLRNTLIIAPTTGIILTKKAELHGYVNPLAFGATGYLCEMADLSDLEIEVMVQERDVAGIYKGQKAAIMPDAYQRDETFLKKHPSGYDGEVSRLMPTADRSKGAIAVRVKVLHIPSDEVGFYLKPDMGANVSFKKKAE